METRLTAPSAAEFDYLGCSMAFSSDGLNIVAGAPYRDNFGIAAGVAEVFVYSGSNWVHQKTLTGPTEADANFGTETAIQEDGSRLVVGAEFEDGSGFSDTGAAYLYHRVGTNWVLTLRLQGDDTESFDRFGSGVGISGDTMVVGARAWDDAVAGQNTGAAYVFVVDTNNVVTQQARLLAADRASGDSFGASVAIQGDRIAVGAINDDDVVSGSGSVYVFERTGTVWTETGKLTASDPGPFSSDQFGFTLAIDGDTIAVGVPNKDIPSGSEGAVYVFVRAGTNWVQQARLLASDIQPLARFGYDVALNGDVLAVGAPFHTSGTNTNIGQTYLFRRDGTNWTECAKFTPSDAVEFDFTGWTVGVSGGRVVVAASDAEVGAVEDAGALYVYELDFNGIPVVPPEIVGVTAINDLDVEITFTTLSNQTYRVDYRDNLTAGGWVTLTNNIAGTGGDVSVTDLGVLASPVRFYRAVLLSGAP